MQRVRDRAAAGGHRALDLVRTAGVEALPNVDLLGLVLGGSESAARAKAASILHQVGTLKELARTETPVLRRKGLTPTRAARVAAALELGRRAGLPDVARTRISTPEDAASLLLPLYQHRTVEHFGILALDARHAVIARRTVSIGTLNANLVHPREVFRAAMELRSAAVVVFHNHPSGSAEPSPEDLALTRRLVEVGRLVGIEVLDHVILGDGCFESLRSSSPLAVGFQVETRGS